MESSEKQLMAALEALNLQYIELQNSKECRVGKSVLALVQDLRKFKFSRMALLIKKKCGQKKIDKLYPGKVPEDNLSMEQRENNLVHVDRKFRVAVYTCIAGAYDSICDPLLVCNGFDYYVYSDGDIISAVWRKRDIPKKALSLKDNTLINRYLKLHPYELFPDYDYAVYIDGNVCVVSDITSLLGVADCDIGIAMHRHVLRDCIYDEAEACILYGKGNPRKLAEQKNMYRAKGFPENYGMLEATVIITNLHRNIGKEILSEWWKEFIHSGSNRDQIALPYVLWKNSIAISEIGSLGNNVYKNPKFRVLSH